MELTADYLRRRFLEDFFEEDFVLLAGILRVLPARRLSFFMPLAFFSSAMLTPYFLEMLLKLSPFLILWLVVAGVLALADLLLEAVDFLEEAAGVAGCQDCSPRVGATLASAIKVSASPSAVAVFMRRS